MPRHPTVLVASLFGAVLIPSSAAAQVQMGSASWCEDSATICWRKDGTAVNGVRILTEPSIGTLVDIGDNKLQKDQLLGGVAFGAEVNLVQAWVATQAFVISPFQAHYDEQSPANDNLLAEDGAVDVEVGGGIGLSFFDGLVSAGMLTVHLDRRDFVDPSLEPNMSEAAFYFNLQPASGIRALIKRVDPS